MASQALTSSTPRRPQAFETAEGRRRLEAMGITVEHSCLAFEIEECVNRGDFNNGRIHCEVYEPEHGSTVAKIDYAPDPVEFDMTGDAHANAGQGLRRMAAEFIAAAERVERKSGAAERAFRVAVAIRGTEQIVAFGGFVTSAEFCKVSSRLADLELVLLPPAHSLNRFSGQVPDPVVPAEKTRATNGRARRNGRKAR
jgi:hypothetical protein